MGNRDKSAAYKSREQRRELAQARETRLMLKFIYIVCVAVLAIVAVLTIRKNGVNTVNFLSIQLPIVVSCALLTLAAAINLIIRKIKKTDESEYVISSVSLFAISLCALALFASYSYIGIEYDAGRIISIIVIALLYFIYNIYDALFFTMSAQCALGVLTSSVLSKTSLGLALRSTGAIVAILLCTVGAFILIKVLDGRSSALTRNYKFYVMSAIVIAGILLSLFIPAIIAYALFGILAVYVVNAVISTIEMM